MWGKQGGEYEADGPLGYGIVWFGRTSDELEAEVSSKMLIQVYTAT